MTNIGQLIKTKRESRGWSLKELQSRSTISDSTISKIENGSHKTPSWETLCKLAKAFDESPLDWLVIAGFITNQDLCKYTPFTSIEKLSETQKVAVQTFIDFIIEKKIIK